jgi:hypothetical protein
VNVAQLVGPLQRQAKVGVDNSGHDKSGEQRPHSLNVVRRNTLTPARFLLRQLIPGHDSQSFLLLRGRARLTPTQ